MMQKNEPCSICEYYTMETEFDCHLTDNCPVAIMKRENEKLKRRTRYLESKISEMQSAASWDEDVRRGQVQGMW